MSLAAAALAAAVVDCARGRSRTGGERGPGRRRFRGQPDRGVRGDQPGSGINFVNSEVEPWVAVNRLTVPTTTDLGDNLIGAWQQDRWNNGGSEGDVTASSLDGGLTWTINANTKSSICTGGTAANGGNYERASDPWVDFSPNGTAYLMSLSVDSNPGGFGTSPNAMLVMRSTDGGATWSDPITLKRDENPNVLNDKNTLTADPNDSDFAYAVWDRLVSPPGETPNPNAFENALAFRGPAWFSRTTNGGYELGDGPADLRAGTLNQTIGNQIVVLPDNAQFDGELVDVFDLIQNRANRPPGPRLQHRGDPLERPRSDLVEAGDHRRPAQHLPGPRGRSRRPESRDARGPDGRHHPAGHGRPEQRGDLRRLPGLPVRPAQQHRLHAVARRRAELVADNQDQQDADQHQPRQPAGVQPGRERARRRDDRCQVLRLPRTTRRTSPRSAPTSSSSTATPLRRPPARTRRTGATRSDHRRLLQHAPGAVRPGLVRRATTSAWTPTARTSCRSGRSHSAGTLETPSSAASAWCRRTSTSHEIERPGHTPGTLRFEEKFDGIKVAVAMDNSGRSDPFDHAERPYAERDK